MLGAASLAAVVLAASGLSDRASAGTFDVKGVEISQGEHELAFGAAWQRGFPVNADMVRQSYEIGYGYGFTDWFKAGVKLGFEQPVGENLEATSAGVEAQALLLNPEKSPIGLAWFTGLDFGLKRGESEVVTFGPLIGFKLGSAIDITLNPLFERAWAPSEPGVNFVYAWQAKTEVSKTVALGIEGYGAIPGIANAPSTDFQEHRIGPVIYLSHALSRHAAGARSMKLGMGNGAGEASEGPKLELQLGVLFGLTEATADTTGRAKLAITW